MTAIVCHDGALFLVGVDTSHPLESPPTGRPTPSATRHQRRPTARPGAARHNGEPDQTLSRSPQGVLLQGIPPIGRSPYRVSESAFSYHIGPRFVSGELLSLNGWSSARRSSFDRVTLCRKSARNEFLPDSGFVSPGVRPGILPGKIATPAAGFETHRGVSCLTQPLPNTITISTIYHIFIYVQSTSTFKLFGPNKRFKSCICISKELFWLNIYINIWKNIRNSLQLCF